MDEGTFGRGKPSAAIGRLSNSAFAEERSDDATLELLFGGAAVLTLLGSAAIPNAAHVSLCSPCQTCELRSPGRLIAGCGHGAINEKVLTEPDSRGLEGFGCGLGRAPPDASPRYRRSAHWRGRKGFAPCADAHAVIGSTVCGCGGYFVASRRSGRRTPAYYGDVLRSGGINGYCRWAGW
jgi:hypothetical protein